MGTHVVTRSQQTGLAPPAALVQRLKARYGEPHRHYHDWDHIAGLIGLFDRFAGRWHAPRAVLWAIYWHDAVFDPAAGDNEARSADLMRREAAGWLSAEDLALAEAMIRATADHRLPDGIGGPAREDMALFLDLDLSALALPPETFAANTDAIRREYSHLDDAAFRAGRTAFFRDLLDQTSIYVSPIGKRLWEAAARRNLTEALKAQAGG